jgi:hypothetical protein
MCWPGWQMGASQRLLVALQSAAEAQGSAAFSHCVKSALHLKS